MDDDDQDLLSPSDKIGSGVSLKEKEDEAENNEILLEINENDGASDFFSL